MRRIEPWRWRNPSSKQGGDDVDALRAFPRYHSRTPYQREELTLAGRYQARKSWPLASRHQGVFRWVGTEIVLLWMYYELVPCDVNVARSITCARYEAFVCERWSIKPRGLCDDGGKGVEIQNIHSTYVIIVNIPALWWRVWMTYGKFVLHMVDVLQLLNIGYWTLGEAPSSQPTNKITNLRGPAATLRAGNDSWTVRKDAPGALRDGLFVTAKTCPIHLTKILLELFWFLRQYSKSASVFCIENENPIQASPPR